MIARLSMRPSRKGAKNHEDHRFIHTHPLDRRYDFLRGRETEILQLFVADLNRSGGQFDIFSAVRFRCRGAEIHYGFRFRSALLLWFDSFDHSDYAALF